MSDEPWIPDALLTLGATMRLTRLVVTDDLGFWLVRGPAFEAVKRRDPQAETWLAKAHSGLDCPFCVGTWIGYGVLAAYLPKRTRPIWRFVMAGLTLNEIAAHIGTRIGDTGATD